MRHPAEVKKTPYPGLLRYRGLRVQTRRRLMKPCALVAGLEVAEVPVPEGCLVPSELAEVAARRVGGGLTSVEAMRLV
jgi:hypothetical protein